MRFLFFLFVFVVISQSGSRGSALQLGGMLRLLLTFHSGMLPPQSTGNPEMLLPVNFYD